MNIVKISNMSKKLNDTDILKDISLELQSNRIYALIGPNGAGKTTLMRILLGLYKPDAGEVTFGINSKSDIGFMLHSNGLYPTMTCYENLELYAKIYKMKNKQRIDEVLMVVGLLEKKNDKVYTLSKGMRQKLAMARAILHNPLFLILDEPTVGLEVETKLWFRSFLKKFVEDKNHTVFLSSHELTELENVCTDVIVLKKGKIVVQTEARLLDGSLEKLYLESDN